MKTYYFFFFFVRLTFEQFLGWFLMSTVEHRHKHNLNTQYEEDREKNEKKNSNNDDNNGKPNNTNVIILSCTIISHRESTIDCPGDRNMIFDKRDISSYHFCWVSIKLRKKKKSSTRSKLKKNKQ